MNQSSQQMFFRPFLLHHSNHGGKSQNDQRNPWIRPVSYSRRKHNWFRGKYNIFGDLQDRLPQKHPGNQIWNDSKNAKEVFQTFFQCISLVHCKISICKYIQELYKAHKPYVHLDKHNDFSEYLNNLEPNI